MADGAISLVKTRLLFCSTMGAHDLHFYFQKLFNW